MLAFLSVASSPVCAAICDNLTTFVADSLRMDRAAICFFRVVRLPASTGQQILYCHPEIRSQRPELVTVPLFYCL